MKKVCEHCGSTYEVEQVKPKKHEHQWRASYTNMIGGRVESTKMFCSGCGEFKTVKGDAAVRKQPTGYGDAGRARRSI